MLQLPTEDPDLEGKAVKLDFQRKEVLPVPTEDPDLQEKGEPNYLLKTLKGCSISDRILFCVTFIFVIFASAATFCSIYFLVPVDEYQQGRDCVAKSEQQINISGVYHLESHDSGYADYLLAMDIPKAAVPHILAASETIVMKTRADQGHIEMTTTTDWVTRKIKFQLNQDFKIHYGTGAGRGILQNHCSRPSHNVIHCSSDEREKGWKFQFDLIFSPLGLTNQRYFITKNVAMKKFYRRE